MTHLLKITPAVLFFLPRHRCAKSAICNVFGRFGVFTPIANSYRTTEGFDVIMCSRQSVDSVKDSSNMKYSEISVVIPCYKEAEVIETNILTVSGYLRDLFDRHEIIVITDGSPDGTADVIDALVKSRSDIPLTHIRFEENRGKGAAVKAGVLASHFETVLFMDADLTIPIEELDEFMSALGQSDIVIASRLAPGAKFDEPVPWYRVLMARGFHLLQILILGNFEFSDTQCGFKLFRRDIALDLFRDLTVDRFAFDAELLFLTRLRDYRVAILPVTVKRDPRNTNVRIVRDPIDMLFSLLHIRLNDLLGRYDISRE